MFRRTIVAGLLAILAIPSAISEPLTKAEAWDYLKANPKAAAEDIVALDSIERAVPEISKPRLVIVYDENGTISAYWDPEPTLELSIADRLFYEITLPEAEADGPKPGRIPRWVAIGAGIAGLAGGIWLGSTLSR
jgi:hypothetical protein